MARSPVALALPGNRLLSRLPGQDFQRVRSLMQPVTLEFQSVLLELHAPITHVYFPLRGVISAITLMRDGDLIEVATIGNEGMVGLGAMLEEQEAPNRLIVQVEVEALRMNADVFRAEISVAGPFRRLLVLYATAYAFQVSQAVACNGLHTIQRRCCRWILLTHDRAMVDEFPLTHEFLSHMLGVRRVSITTVLKPLQKAGLIHNRRGRVVVLNRKGLERAACECYQAVRDEFDHLFDSEDRGNKG
jgi:CRP-like cAMP-binding protein